MFPKSCFTFCFSTIYVCPLSNMLLVSIFFCRTYLVCMSTLGIHDRMRTRIMYSSEFLLLFGELEHCKRLAPDFDTLGSMQ